MSVTNICPGTTQAGIRCKNPVAEPGRSCGKCKGEIGGVGTVSDAAVRQAADATADVDPMAAGGGTATLTRAGGGLDQWARTGIAEYAADPTASPAQNLERWREANTLISQLTDAEAQLTLRMAAQAKEGDTFTLPDGSTAEFVYGKPRDRFNDDELWDEIASRAAKADEPEAAVAALAQQALTKGGYRTNQMRMEGVNPTYFSDWVGETDEDGNQVYNVVPERIAPSTDDDVAFRNTIMGEVVSGTRTAEATAERIVAVQKLKRSLREQTQEHARVLRPHASESTHALSVDGVGDVTIAAAGRYQGWNHEGVWRATTDRLKSTRPNGSAPLRARAATDRLKTMIRPTWSKKWLKAEGLEGAHSLEPGLARLKVTRN